MTIDKRINIGDLAKATGVKVVTIRYYEQVDLMPVTLRTRGNYRSYKLEHVQRLHFIRRCRDLGFRLDEIRELLRLSAQANRECSEIDRMTAIHLRVIEEKISDLNTLADELRQITACCPGNRTIESCRILEALSVG